MSRLQDLTALVVPPPEEGQPRRVWLTDTLPIGPSGKIVKRSITIPEPDEAG